MSWHGKAPNDEEYETAMRELTARLAERMAETLAGEGSTACAARFLYQTQSVQTSFSK